MIIFLNFIKSSVGQHIILLTSIVILIFLLIGQCQSNANSKEEITRLNNNRKAKQDTIKYYKDQWGNTVGKVKGLTLTIDELKKENDSLEIKNSRPPITIIRYETKVVEKLVEVPVYVRDTTVLEIVKGDTIKFDSSATIVVSDTFGKSSRDIDVSLPFKIDTSILFGKATINLKQNIWLSAGIYKDKKTKEVFVELKTDYPGITFNNTKGILINNKSKQFRKFNFQNRKSFGIGIHLGYGYSPLNNTFLPYVGIGVQYSPKFLQW
tara:strand:- start:65189 stop:65986 length:798 start_codon:yes stop_codon:yes gene_type:complete